ncbi:MAG: DUF2807 domain-containing protein [Bacteroidota bacterium]
MKRSNLILIGALGAILLFSMAFQLTVNRYAHVIEKRPKTEEWTLDTRNPGAFAKVNSNSDITLVYKKDTTSLLEIKSNGIHLDSIITKVEREELKIDILQELKRKDSIAIVITAPTLNGITLGGKSHFITQDTLTGTQLKLELKEKSAASILLDYKHVAYTNTSSGTVEIKGSLNQININNVVEK